LQPIIEFINNKRSPLNIAHRGGMGLYPENTLLGFHSSVDKHNADILEMDLKITKDGKVCIFHDDLLDRTTNGKGKVCDHTYHEISQLDAGYWFNNNNIFQYRDQGIKVSLLEDIFEEFPETYVNLELKDNDDVMVHEVLRIINKYNASDRIIIGSGNLLQNRLIQHVIHDCAHFLSEVDLYLFITFGNYGWYKKYWQRFHVVEVPLKHYGFHVYPLFKSAAEKIGIPIFVWGANDHHIIRKMKADNIDGIITDRPDLV